MHSSITKVLLNRMRQTFPPLKQRTLESNLNSVAVVGGSFQFTGAPFYSAISALRVGGDLSHIFCSKFSAPAIKSYSPQIIVHPVFVSEQQLVCSQQQVQAMLQEWTGKLKEWQKAIKSWIIGPGLGRDRYMQDFFPYIVKNLPDGCLAIFDADGIYYLCNNPELFEELSRFKVILTPNHRQLAFLQRYFRLDLDSILKYNESQEEISEISSSFYMKNFKILIKGEHDVVLGSDRSFIVRTLGGNKRCGGIGDLLAGVTSVCALWDFEYGPVLASRIVKIASRIAYEKQGRGMTAPNVIQQLPLTVKFLQNEIL